MATVLMSSVELAQAGAVALLATSKAGAIRRRPTRERDMGILLVNVLRCRKGRQRSITVKPTLYDYIERCYELSARAGR
ncbi:protein of unknown function [Alcaligenes faecalis subsp. faecalis]|nr:protein of unknown function [Alcaligenes faecalis subsp. faecalis]